MAKLNIDFLIKTPIKTLLDKIDYFFRELLREIESYLQIEVCFKKKKEIMLFPLRVIVKLQGRENP